MPGNKKAHPFGDTAERRAFRQPLHHHPQFVTAGQLLQAGMKLDPLLVVQYAQEREVMGQCFEAAAGLVEQDGSLGLTLAPAEQGVGLEGIRQRLHRDGTKRRIQPERIFQVIFPFADANAPL